MGSTFFSTGTVGTLEKKYLYRSGGGTFISQFLGGTRYFCKTLCNKKNHKEGEVCATAPFAAIVRMICF